MSNLFLEKIKQKRKAEMVDKIKEEMKKYELRTVYITPENKKAKIEKIELTDNYRQIYKILKRRILTEESNKRVYDDGELDFDEVKKLLCDGTIGNEGLEKIKRLSLDTIEMLKQMWRRGSKETQKNEMLAWYKGTKNERIVTELWLKEVFNKKNTELELQMYWVKMKIAEMSQPILIRVEMEKVRLELEEKIEKYKITEKIIIEKGFD